MVIMVVLMTIQEKKAEVNGHNGSSYDHSREENGNEWS